MSMYTSLPHAALSIAYPCAACLGGTRRPSNGEPCGACGGSGLEYMQVATVWCVTCGGTGALRDADDPVGYWPCPDCDEDTGQRTVSVRPCDTLKVCKGIAAKYKR
jgi:DnaJ-class molecular chaperone